MDLAALTLYDWADSLLSLIKRIFTNISTCDDGIGSTLARVEQSWLKCAPRTPEDITLYQPAISIHTPTCKITVVSNYYDAALEARNCGCQMCATLSKLLVFATFVEAYTLYSLAEAWIYTLDHDWLAAIEKRNKVWLQDADIIADLHHHWDSTWNSSGRRMGYEQVSPSNRGLTIPLIPNTDTLQNDGSSSEFNRNDPLLTNLKEETVEIFPMSSMRVQDIMTKMLHPWKLLGKEMTIYAIFASRIPQKGPGYPWSPCCESVLMSRVIVYHAMGRIHVPYVTRKLPVVSVSSQRLWYDRVQ